jgi:pimeloyl-ACP methyl ester carboxylesterase
MNLSVLLVALFAVSVSLAAFPPLVIVPGIGSSQLNAQSNITNIPEFCPINTVFQAWFSIATLLYEGTCVYTNLPLAWSREGVATDLPDVDVSVRHPWSTASIEYLDDNPETQQDSLYFYEFVEFLVTNAGYVRDVNITAAPFDWRHSPDAFDGYFEHLQANIEALYKTSKSKVVLVGHSYGSKIVHTFLTTKVSLFWKLRYISAFVPISPPWTGVVNAPQAVISGTNFNAPGVVNPELARGPERSFESTYYFFPSIEGWPLDQPFVQTSTRNYTNTQWDRLLLDLDLRNATEIRERVAAKTPSPSIPPFVPTYVYHGSGVSTPLLLQYATDLNSALTIVGGDGDGTVPSASLLYVNGKWPSLTYTEIAGAGHNSILYNPTALAAIYELLSTL